MNSKELGLTLAALRKKHGLTQAALAERLHVSDKTVSKWESGLGFPEVTQFPAIAEIFGVTVDYLMTGRLRGITLAGNIIADIVKRVNCYPEKGMLANILSVSKAVGGSAPNTGIDLAKIDPSLPVSVLGRVGDDDYGSFILKKMQECGIDVSGVKISSGTPTSFSDVMSLPSGERTFFSFRGANADFSPEDVDVSALTCNIFHIGYILLLDKMDAEDEEYGTALARLLHSVQQRGIKTSIDVVSSSNADDYAKKILPALPYCDYVIVNEIECCYTFGINPRNEDGTLNTAAVETAMRKMQEKGVREKVIVHAKEGGFALSSDGSFTKLGNLNIDRSLIKGSVGAGDAFCAGSLYGIYNGFSDKEILTFAAAAAACNLFAENSVDGMRSADEIRKLISENKMGEI